MNWLKKFFIMCYEDYEKEHAPFILGFILILAFVATGVVLAIRFPLEAFFTVVVIAFLVGLPYIAVKLGKKFKGQIENKEKLQDQEWEDVP